MTEVNATIKSASQSSFRCGISRDGLLFIYSTAF